jgi:hypothetical protein
VKERPPEEARGAVSFCPPSIMSRTLELLRCSLPPQCVNVLLRKLHDEMILAATPGPAIAFHTTE